MRTQEEKGATFKALHSGEPFVIPNPWDAGSARVLEALGFKALATTSSGFAFTLGLLDGEVTIEQIAGHVSSVTGATDLPLSVDLENGYGPRPEDAALAIRTVAEAGAVGGSIEDWDRDDGVFYELGPAAERVAAAAEAARALPFPFTLTGRAENFVRDNPDLGDAIARLQAYEAAGADVLFAPRLRTLDEVRVVCQAVSKPVNVLAMPGISMLELVEAGAQRVSVGGRFTWVAAKAMVDAALAIRDRGDFSSMATSLPLEEWFAD